MPGGKGGGAESGSRICRVAVGLPSNIERRSLKGIYPEFQVIRGFSQKIPAGLLSYDQIHS